MLLLLALPVVLALSFHPWLVAGYLGILTFYLGLHVPIALRLRRDLPATDLLYFFVVVSLRDIARALGLVRGVWQFTVLGRRV